MPRYLNPKTVPAPASRYSQAVAVGAPFKRLIISGQLGIAPDGVLAAGIDAQMAQAWDNVLALVAAADLEPADLVKTTVYVTVPGSVAVYRKLREAKLGKHQPAATYLEIAGLARPEFLVEIEAEAVREAAAARQVS